MDSTNTPDIQDLETLLQERYVYLTARNQAENPGRERHQAQCAALLQMLTEQAHRIALLERRQLADAGVTTSTEEIG